MSWVNVAILATAIIVSIILRPKPPNQKPPSLDDFQIPTADEGRPIPVIFGRVVSTGPNIVWWGDVAYQPVRTKSGK